MPIKAPLNSSLFLNTSRYTFRCGLARYCPIGRSTEFKNILLHPIFKRNMHTFCYFFDPCKAALHWRGNLFGSPSRPYCYPSCSDYHISLVGASGFSRSGCTLSLLAPCCPIGLPSQLPVVLIPLWL